MGGQRRETLRAVPATQPPPIQTPADARCTAHTGVADPGPCRGCKTARERAEQALHHVSEQQRREDEHAAITCTRCDGTWVVDPATKLPTRHRCDHRRTA